MTRALPIFAVLLLSTLIIGSSSAWAAQLDVKIDPNSSESKFQVRYQRTIFIEYNQGGQLADELRQQSWEVTKMADSSTPGVAELKTRINQKLSADGSGTKISDLNVDYSAKLTGRGLNTSIDYKVILYGTISDYTLREYSANSPALVDMAWRGITISGPVVIDGIEINLPISAIKDNQVNVYDALIGTGADEILSTNIINADGIRDQPLSNWHFLFDPTGINVDAGTFGLSEEISGFVVSSYTMGESSLREGRQVEKVKQSEFTLDRPYVVRSVESADSSNVDIIGFAAVEVLEGGEFFGVSPRAPEGYATTSTGEFPVMIIYGMAGMAGVGAIAIFFISNRKLKQEAAGPQGQTGIDPSQLTGYQTSTGSGGYQTNRGEAQLKGTSDYQRTRSVYEEGAQAETKQDDTPQSTKGSMPKGWKPE